ncbi:MAG: DNA polymerase sliding clamp [Caldisphaeraceae archaeon]|nr:DNA polymerase sliding clamp [Caldisphaeraceae archaeon]
MVKVRAVYQSGNKLKKIAQALARINDEGIFNFSDDGLLSWFFSPDKTVLGIFKVSSTAFEELSLDGSISIGVDMNDLSKVLRRATRNDKISLEYSTGHGFMKVLLIDEKTGVERSFEVSAGESEEREIREINMKPTARFVISPNDIDTMINDAKLVADVLKFIGKDNGIIVEASGEEKFYRWEMRLEDPLDEVAVEDYTEASYSLNALGSSIKPVTTIAESISMEFATDYPLKMDFNISGPEEFIMYIAPISY